MNLAFGADRDGEGWVTRTRGLHTTEPFRLPVTFLTARRGTDDVSFSTLWVAAVETSAS